MDIAIFGGGVAGLAAAAALSSDGHRCRVFERREQAAGSGMAFILTPCALPALAELGVRPEGGEPLRHFLHRDAAGRLLARQPMPAGARCVLRQRLVQDLAASLAGRVDVEHGAVLQGFCRAADGRVRQAVLAGGRSVRADLYVAADGSRSLARSVLFPGWAQGVAPVHEVVGLVDDAQGAAWAGTDFNKFHAPAEGLAFGLLPAHGSTLVWYLQHDSRRHPAAAAVTPAALADFVARRVGHWGDPLPRLLARVDFARAHRWQPVACEPVPRFHHRNLVLLGDAAHPLLPFTSQGTAAAVLDALALRDQLRRLGRTAPEAALAAYSAERRAARSTLAERGLALQAQFLDASSAPALPVAPCVSPVK